MVQTVHLE